MVNGDGIHWRRMTLICKGSISVKKKLGVHEMLTKGIFILYIFTIICILDTRYVVSQEIFNNIFRLHASLKGVLSQLQKF